MHKWVWQKFTLIPLINTNITDIIIVIIIATTCVSITLIFNINIKRTELLYLRFSYFSFFELCLMWLFICLNILSNKSDVAVKQSSIWHAPKDLPDSFCHLTMLMQNIE